jgi:hypothetical protein
MITYIARSEMFVGVSGSQASIQGVSGIVDVVE